MNRYQKKGWTIPLIFLPGLTALLYLWTIGSGATAVAAPSSPAAEPVWTQPITLTTAADSPNDVTLPVVKASPDGKTVMVVYNWGRSAANGDNDPYYSRSTDNGETWSAPTAIYSNTTTSKQVHMDYAADGVAHVVWQEDTGLDYAYETSVNPDSWSTPVPLIAPGGSPGVENPYLVASGSSRLDVIWSEGKGTIPTRHIYHIRSKDSGNTWPITSTVRNSGNETQFPAMAVDDQTGVIHAVWQENDNLAKPNYGTIMYAQGTESGGIITWSPPITLSTEEDAREPSILFIGDTLHVVYTWVRHDGGVDPDKTQFVQHTQCASQCTGSGNWSTSSSVSGTKVGANGVEPLNVVAALTQRGNCAISYFHGIQEGNPNNTEVILGVNSCNAWGSSLPERMTPTEVQSINPSLDVQNGWWLYLAYERDTNGVHQIYLHRDRPPIYLPVVFR